MQLIATAPYTGRSHEVYDIREQNPLSFDENHWLPVPVTHQSLRPPFYFLQLQIHPNHYLPPSQAVI